MPRSTSRFESIATAVMAVCAIVVTVVVVSRSGGSDTSGAEVAERVELAATTWDSAMHGANTLGSLTAPVHLVVFADFQCPACRGFASNVLPKIRADFKDQLVVTYRYWPLAYHPQALPAAYAAECAAAQGHFWALHDTLYAQQSVLGQKSYARLASEAGVPDTVALNACMSSPETAKAVERDQKFAERLGAQGTPTVIVDGTILKSGALQAVLSKEINNQISKHSESDGATLR